jgi:hypothetical protein
MFSKILRHLGSYIGSIVLAFIAFYLSLVATSLPPTKAERAEINNAIAVLTAKGFTDEVFVLKRTTTFRATDHWLNSFVDKENAYASTNFPFQIVTVYGDFFYKTSDDTERAMVLLHEARHLLGEDERDAYAYVWKNRERLGWTMEKYGTSEIYVTIEQQTHENAPELFNCPDKPWEDCTL